jgi:small conductance mechanosensitive channel
MRIARSISAGHGTEGPVRPDVSGTYAWAEIVGRCPHFGRKETLLMTVQDLLNALGARVLSELDGVVFSVIAVIIGLVLYRLLAREIGNLRQQSKLDTHVAYTLTRIAQWIITLAVLSAILAHFGVTVAVISGLLTLLGGTIIGFAAINTIGNALAGLIVMTSRPFRVGDRIFFNGQFADVIAIELIYTKMVTLDNVAVSVPNQQLLQDEIDNFGEHRVIRRHVSVTPGFEYEAKEVEAALTEAASRVSRVLSEPAPYVWITGIQSYAVEHTLYAFIDDARALPEVDAELHRSVLKACKDYGIDISTPVLVRSVQSEES